MTESGYKASFASEGKVIEGDERQLLADFIPTQIKKPTKKEPLSDDAFVFVIAHVMLNVTNDKDTPNSALKSNVIKPCLRNQPKLKSCNRELENLKLN